MYGAPTVLLVLADMEKSPNAWSDAVSSWATS